MELRHLRCLVAIVDTGSFTDAALELGLSQAAVSRTLAALEDILQVRLLHRTSRSVAPTTIGVQVLARARSLLNGADELVREVATGHSRLHIGHAWSAFGDHTTEFQRLWHKQHPETDLRFIRHNTPTGGLAEGLCDLAVVRAPLDLGSWSHALIGQEARLVALASDDPWAKRRSIRLDEIPTRTLAIDRRTGTTALGLWPGDEQPSIEYTGDIDDWLSVISTAAASDSPRGHSLPVPSRRHHVSSPARCPARARLRHLAPARLPPGHAHCGRSGQVALLQEAQSTGALILVPEGLRTSTNIGWSRRVFRRKRATAAQADSENLIMSKRQQRGTAFRFRDMRKINPFRFTRSRRRIGRVPRST